jgi:nucleotide-binding universal stress UspA family protein
MEVVAFQTAKIDMIRFNNILCPIDLSVASERSLRYSIALAKSYEAKLYICHCIEPGGLEYWQTREEALDALTKKIDDAVISHLTLAGPQSINYEALIVEGDPDTAIAQAAANLHIDLIVMCSRRRPVAAALLGSTAEAICRTAPCPVLVTHPNEREWVGKTTGEIDLNRILVAHDFSLDSELAFSYATLLAQEYQAELHLIHVMPYSSKDALKSMPPGEADAFHEAAERLQQSVPPEVFLWSKVYQVVRSGQPYREILMYAQDKEIDLICMGVHGAGFAMHALFGSNSDRVLRQSPCPVLIARPLKPNVVEK